jgi:elongator complex protein 2
MLKALTNIQDEGPEGVSSLLSGHAGIPKTLKFLPPTTSSEESSFLLSGGEDKTLKVWTVRKQFDSSRCVQSVSDAHKSPIVSLATVAIPGSKTALVVSGSVAMDLKIWLFDAGSLQLLQSISIANLRCIPLALALTTIGQNDEGLVLAAGGSSSIIHILTSSGKSGGFQFAKQASLTGHEGWIRSLDFQKGDGASSSDILLASASQDKYVRLWRISQGTEAPVVSSTDGDAVLPGKSPSNKAHHLTVANVSYFVTFDSLLLGHDDWIYTARWHPTRPQLLSTSADNSLSIWEADPASGIWITTARLGELSREKGATTATGSTGGFWTGLWSPSGTSVTTLGRTGSWRRWTHSEAGGWTQATAVTGHTRAVTGLAWQADGAYLLSAGADQTTRLHAECGGAGDGGAWRELARPQIHGYDLNCIAALGGGRFVSGADEKLYRVFREPRAAARLRARLTGGEVLSSAEEDDLPDAADMPVLGLSNKAVVEGGGGGRGGGGGEGAQDHNMATAEDPLDINHPPFEDALSRHTLWPEMEKLYGHGYEVCAVAAARGGHVVATACKASSVNHAVVRLFETARWTEVRPPLAAHSLTVARLRFSADNALLLSVGRDRQWAVFQAKEAGGVEYDLLQRMEKAHTRMILDCSWAPAGEGMKAAFVTAGRDKCVKVWVEGEKDGKMVFGLAATLAQKSPVTAVDFLDRQTKSGSYLLAVGTEAGQLSLLSLSPSDLKVASTVELDARLVRSADTWEASMLTNTAAFVFRNPSYSLHGDRLDPPSQGSCISPSPGRTTR